MIFWAWPWGSLIALTSTLSGNGKLMLEGADRKGLG